MHATAPQAACAGLRDAVPRPVHSGAEQHGGATGTPPLQSLRTQNDDWILVAVQTMHHFPWWEVYDASKQELEEVSTGLLDSLQTLLAIPFDTALTVYQEYVEKYSPPLPRQLVNASTAGSAPG